MNLNPTTTRHPLSDPQEDSAGDRLAMAMKKLGATLQARKVARKATAPEATNALAPITQETQPTPIRKEENAKVVQLPIWPAQTRGTPNSFLRGALFAAIQGKERRALKAELLAAQQGIEILFTGWQLDQSDLDVWEQAVQLAASHPLGNVCLFKIKSFLQALGRHDGKSDREWLKDAFRRLMASGVEIKHGPYTYGGSLLEFWQDEQADAYQLQLNTRILSLYSAGWTAIDWEMRRKLRRKPLALWLHGWLSSHAENYPTKVETIRHLSGSRNSHKGSFKRQLATALSDLEAISLISAWSIDSKTDLVSIKRTPSSPQQRHLIRKLSKPRKQPIT